MFTKVKSKLMPPFSHKSQSSCRPVILSCPPFILSSCNVDMSPCHPFLLSFIIFYMCYIAQLLLTWKYDSTLFHLLYEKFHILCYSFRKKYFVPGIVSIMSFI